MCDDDGYVISCPFCGEANECTHLVAAFDHENAVIAGGLFFDRETELGVIVTEGFEAALAAHGEFIDWHRDRLFEEAWDDFLCQRDDGDVDPIHSGILARVLDSLLQNTDAEPESQESVTAFYSRHPQTIYDSVVADFRKACSNARAKA